MTVDNEFADFEAYLDAKDAKDNFLETGNQIFVWEAFNILNRAGFEIPDWITKELFRVSERILEAANPKTQTKTTAAHLLGLKSNGDLGKFHKYRNINKIVIERIDALLQNYEGELNWQTMKEENSKLAGYPTKESAYEHLAQMFNITETQVKRIYNNRTKKKKL